jgi:phosphoadenosine phosphosulfate reductase
MSALPDAVDAAAREQAHRVLGAVPPDRDTLALVSGGHDSLTAMHVAYAHPEIALDGIVHINTGIGIPETRRFVRQRARALDLDYYEIGRPESDTTDGSEYRRRNAEYEHLVRTLGFPGPPLHNVMYYSLKEKPLQAWLRDHYPDADEKPTLVSGVRRHESERRKMNVTLDGVQEYVGCTTVSPVVAFTGMDVRRYRRARDLPMNPVVEKLELSGDCLCGAFSSRGELRMIRLFYPQVWRRIKALEAVVSAASYTDDGPDEAYTQWGHNRLKDREREAMADRDQMLLCESCERQCDGDDRC